ncbi:DMT family transporter [Croceicoccus ponticola]|uniref:DMT family transporter n=1 Tax=Croceicoccus ponticola TaxID=2217664 RepID=A0A437GX89_9SPHN|nr:DMT family transporter [Croceicoccus ponticola]RVQ66994.1 DMT family transporter [Croceicoccus ponticola]
MTTSQPHAGAWRFGLLLLGNAALASGPLLVRLADTGPVAAGFWRLALALPLIAFLAWREGGREKQPGRMVVWLALGAGVAFGLDVASWHLGIERTRLGNAALFGNAGSVILIAWGLMLARRAPFRAEVAAIGAALGGAALLMGGSLEISPRNFTGDLLSLLAGILYAVYILMLRHIRTGMGSWRLLTVSSLSATPVLLICALMLGETILPREWTPLLMLALCSQVVGQGVLVWALAWFRPLVIGLALLTQPAIAALSGWLAFGETLAPGDVLGMALMAAALVLARVAEPKVANTESVKV